MKMFLVNVFKRTLFSAARSEASNAASVSSAKSMYNPLEAFFEADRSQEEEKPVVYGRGWKASELRLKSWDDLQKLWYVLLKEKNMLMTQRQMLNTQNLRFPNPERIPKVQGLVNTFGDLRGTLAAIERINFVLSGTDTDDSLAYGLERELNEKEVCNESLKLFYNEGFTEENFAPNKRFMSALKSASNGCSVAWSGDICLEDVHFSYPLRPDVKVLSGLNLTLKCGTVTALVGSSGAGKSTIVQLLARFYEPTRGRITVSGEDVRTFDKSEWARVVSIVNQEPVLFSASVGENIAYGLPDDNVSKDAVIKAAKAANAHEFIISLPQGYDTLVGERGGLLSGGQRQRVAIARALLKNAPILILDEATSALDAVSERLVQDALNQLMKGRTTLVIAHRLSTVQNAHQIALCSDGKIEELGTHSELLARKGQYASLVGTQRLAFE